MAFITQAELQNITQISVSAYNTKVTKDYPEEARVIDTNQNGIIDSKDEFISPEKGILRDVQHYEALETTCALMTPYQTHLLTTPKAYRFLNQSVNGRERSYVEKGPNSETVHIYSSYLGEYLPFQSFGRFIIAHENLKTSDEGCALSTAPGAMDMIGDTLKTVAKIGDQCIQEYLNPDTDNRDDFYRSTEDPNDCPEDYVK
jgi:hypothetical protein